MSSLIDTYWQQFSYFDLHLLTIESDFSVKAHILWNLTSMLLTCIFENVDWVYRIETNNSQNVQNTKATIIKNYSEK